MMDETTFSSVSAAFRQRFGSVSAAAFWQRFSSVSAAFRQRFGSHVFGETAFQQCFGSVSAAFRQRFGSGDLGVSSMACSWVLRNSLYLKEFEETGMAHYI